MLIPISTDYRMTIRPWVNYGLVLANVLLFVLGYSGAGNKNIALINDYLLHPDSPQLVQFFSSMFLHGSWAHLIGNMIFLWVFGNAMDDRFGHVGYLAFYLAGGVLAGVGYVLMGGDAPVLGASGAIAAVTGAYLVLLPRVRVTLLVWLLYLVTPFQLSSLYFLAFQFIFNVTMSMMGEGKLGGGSDVAYVAHSSGYLFGIVTAAVLLAFRVLPRDPYDLLNLLRAHRRRGRYRQMVSQGYDPFRAAPGRTGRWVDTQVLQADTPSTASAQELALRKEISELHGRHDIPAAAQKYLQLVQINPEAVLPRQQQLDVANQLMADEVHAAAAAAYERLLTQYPDFQHPGDIYLMLGLLYRRYIHQPERARHFLELALQRLQDGRKIELAQAELHDLKKHKEP